MNIKFYRLRTVLQCVRIKQRTSAQPYYSANHMRRSPILLRLFIILLTSTLTSFGFTREHSLAVIYPDVQEPYRSVFSAIIKGIEEQARVPIKRYLITPNTNNDSVHRWLADEDPKVIIALGQRGLEVIRVLGEKIPAVVGAALISHDEPNTTGISLAANPEKLFAQLRQLAPGIKRVFTVYSPMQNEWLITLAKERASTHQLELVAFSAQNIRQAAQLYQDILNSTDSTVDAIWLPLDRTLDEDAILTTILKMAWERNLIVFSSNPAHAKKGALFSLYPNNIALGRSLVDLAESHARLHTQLRTPQGNDTDGPSFSVLKSDASLADAQDPHPDSAPINNHAQAQANRQTDASVKTAGSISHHEIVPLSDVLTAINIRTADHLGLNISDEDQRQFGLVFPTP